MLTIHRSKGLEFPIVYCPYLWEPGYIPRDAEPGRLPRPRRAATRARSTSGSTGPDFRRHQQPAPASSSAARTCGSPTSRSPARSTRRSSGGRGRGTAATRRSARLLFARDADGQRRAPTGRGTPDRRGGASRASRRSRPQAPGCISVERAALGPPRALGGARRAEPAELAAARFDREPRPALAAHVLQRHHRRRARGAGGERAGGGGASPTSRAGARRPPPAGRPATTPALRAVAVAAGRRCRPACTSARSCTACSRRPTSPRADLDAELARARRRRRRRGGTSTSATRRRSSPGCARRSRRRSARCSAALRLRDVARADRLDELDFELPLAGGDEPTGAARRSTAIAARAARAPARRATRSPATPSGSRDPALRRDVRGYLTGSIDLVRPRSPAAAALRRRRLQDELARRRRARS